MLHDSRESLNIALVEMQESMSKGEDCGQLHDVVCWDLQDAGTRVNEAKRKADDAQDQVQVDTERCRHPTSVRVTAEENMNEGWGRRSELIRDTAGSAHSSSCGTTDRDCNEVKYLQEAMDMLESFHTRDTRRRGDQKSHTLVERSR